MGTQQYALGLAALGGKLYAVGGTPDYKLYVKTAEVFDPATGKWSALSPMGTSRQCLGVAACC